MPGFNFHFFCNVCDKSSRDYSLFYFEDIFSADIYLPAWSLKYKCWMTIQAELNFEQRKKMESEHNVLVEFVKTLSSKDMTVCIPYYNLKEKSIFVKPEAICPYCERVCEIKDDSSLYREKNEVIFSCLEEFRATPLSMLSLMHYTRTLCEKLNFKTIGHLEDGKEKLKTQRHRRIEIVLDEVDRVLSYRPKE